MVSNRMLPSSGADRFSGSCFAHGVTNTTLFVVMSDLMQHGSIQSRIVLALAVLWGTVLAGISTIMLIMRARNE